MKKIITISALLGLVFSSSVVSADDALKSCYGCHGTDFSKKALGNSKIVSNMSEKDIVSALKGYKNRTYGGVMKGVMYGQVNRLSISPEAAASQIKNTGAKTISSNSVDIKKLELQKLELQKEEIIKKIEKLKKEIN